MGNDSLESSGKRRHFNYVLC